VDVYYSFTLWLWQSHSFVRKRILAECVRGASVADNDAGNVRKSRSASSTLS
jgi:hypothetical protein